MDLVLEVFKTEIFPLSTMKEEILLYLSVFVELKGDRHFPCLVHWSDQTLIYYNQIVWHQLQIAEEIKHIAHKQNKIELQFDHNIIL